MQFPTAALVSALALAAPAMAQSREIADLRTLSGLSPIEWNAVSRGEPQSKLLETREKREVAIVGVTRVRAGVGCFVTMLQDIENFKRNADVLRIRKLAVPLGPDDLDGFRLEPEDVAALRHCKTGDCNVKLPVPAMERIARGVDWERQDHAVEVESIVQEEIRAYIGAYFDRGNAALIEYRDKKKPVRLTEEFGALLGGRPGVADSAPEFQKHLALYPSEKLEGVSEFFYWSTESFGLGPVTSVTHVSVHVRPGQAVAASKQIFATHYFDASLGLTVAVDDGSGMYLFYLNRSRIDLLGGFFGGLRRAFARGRMLDGMRNNLADATRKLELSCGAPPQSAPRAQSRAQE